MNEDKMSFVFVEKLNTYVKICYLTISPPK